jgi:hypothetical protein
MEPTAPRRNCLLFTSDVIKLTTFPFLPHALVAIVPAEMVAVIPGQLSGFTAK